jgi:hypothetical protein
VYQYNEDNQLGQLLAHRFHLSDHVIYQNNSTQGIEAPTNSTYGFHNPLRDSPQVLSRSSSKLAETMLERYMLRQYSAFRALSVMALTPALL